MHRTCAGNDCGQAFGARHDSCVRGDTAQFCYQSQAGRTRQRDFKLQHICWRNVSSDDNRVFGNVENLVVATLRGLDLLPQQYSQNTIAYLSHIDCAFTQVFVLHGFELCCKRLDLCAECPCWVIVFFAYPLLRIPD